MDSPIPMPQLRSWMHERIVLPKDTVQKALERYRKQPVGPQAIDAVLSRVFHFFHALDPKMRPTSFKLVAQFFHIYFRIFHRIRIYGLENVPKHGAIFTINHPGTFDPLILLSSLPMQIGAISAWGLGWFADMMEYGFGWLALRHQPREMIVERMIRQIIKNPFFGVAPEGYPHYNDRIEQGQSSIIRVYAAINADKDRIPFVPTWIRGSGMYTPKPRIKPGPIEIHFFPPFFLKREWLRSPNEGGKSPRELIDYVMLRFAHHAGQKALFPNALLEKKYQWIKAREEKKKNH
jgi:1-acyl-sn-glycerol-3-phosphate acyltransferase